MVLSVQQWEIIANSVYSASIAMTSVELLTIWQGVNNH